MGLAPLLAIMILSDGPAEQQLRGLLRQHAPSLLEQSRLPTAADVIHDWAWFASERKAVPYRISADFNGDGRPDYAFVLLSKVGYRIVFGALVSSANGYVVFKLRDEDAGDESSQHRYCVAVVPPGRYTTAAGFGHNAGAAEQREVVHVHPAIDFIYTESSDTFYYWHAQDGAFHDVAITE